MMPQKKLLDGCLRPTTKPEDARFSESERILAAYKAKLYGDVEELYRSDPGQGFHQFLNAEKLVLRNKVWSASTENAHQAGVLFTREEGAATTWVATIKDHTVRILGTCDARDAAQWVSVFEEITSADTPARKINILKNTEFILGAHDENPLNIAGVGNRTIFFFNHHETGRLFTCGVETATAKWEKPTSIRNTILHECAHLFEPVLEEEIARTSDVIFDAFNDNESAKSIIMETALAINPDYLVHIFQEDYARSTVPNYKNQETEVAPASRTLLALHCAKEIVAEAFSRYVLDNEVLPTLARGGYAQGLINRLRHVTLQPIVLPKAGEDPLRSTMQAPVSLKEALTKSLRRIPTEAAPLEME